MKEIIRSEIVHGITGISFSSAGIYVSMQHVEAWLRVISLLIGIAVGVATFISIVRKIKNNTPK